MQGHTSTPSQGASGSRHYLFTTDPSPSGLAEFERLSTSRAEYDMPKVIQSIQGLHARVRVGNKSERRTCACALSSLDYLQNLGTLSASRFDSPSNVVPDDSRTKQIVSKERRKDGNKRRWTRDYGGNSRPKLTYAHDTQRTIRQIAHIA